MRQQSYFGCGGCRRHNREDCGRGSRAYVPDVSEVFRAFSGYSPPLFFRVTPRCSRRDPGLNFAFVSFAARVCCKFAAWMCCKETTNKTKQQ